MTNHFYCLLKDGHDCARVAKLCGVSKEELLGWFEGEDAIVTPTPESLVNTMNPKLSKVVVTMDGYILRSWLREKDLTFTEVDEPTFIAIARLLQ